MNRLTGISVLSLLAALAAPVHAEEALRASDQVAATEAPALRAVYEGANAAFGRGDYVTALRELDYAAWQGSVAAAMRLCVLDAYGIGTAPNPAKAAFWCERARTAGHDLAQVQRYLEGADIVAH